MNNKIYIPVGRFADDEALKKKREELKKKLLEGQKIPIGTDGNVTDDSGQKGIVIPPGKLADDEALKKKREELKKKLLEGQKIPIGTDGNVTDDNGQKGIVIPPGKLAVSQWYDRDPGLLEAEKAAMQQAFPGFELDKLDDGRFAWVGSLNIGCLGDNKWHIMAIYNNNHPQQVMGSSVRVYLVEPDIDELIGDLGWQPTHLLRDSNNQLYLCTAEADNVKAGKQVSSAASVIAWAVKWLMAFELVLSGDLSKEAFNQHRGI
ncbi:hypothetical protein D0T53_00295 [Dysgonomonas sp. 216]|uniref:hypothetical protein n=1 Tax=Dysgonomonas sp. 216 TaxID=2302934 RepID=UPI0013D7C042|nr:hypothetical protein [Dysgonomonas sp. 216]NDW17353.1 hypothetical protein [Dysgonomonas sp. 216]